MIISFWQKSKLPFKSFITGIVYSARTPTISSQSRKLSVMTANFFSLTIFTAPSFAHRNMMRWIKTLGAYISPSSSHLVILFSYIGTPGLFSVNPSSRLSLLALNILIPMHRNYLLSTKSYFLQKANIS